MRTGESSVEGMGPQDPVTTLVLATLATLAPVATLACHLQSTIASCRGQQAADPESDVGPGLSQLALASCADE
jgi:hypothetical protein